VTDPDDPLGGNSGELGERETVKLLFAYAQDNLLADERDRQRHFDTKAGTMTGFVAVALSLEAGLGASTLIDNNLDCAAMALFTLFFFIAVGALVLSAIFAVLGVLVPKPYLGVDDEELSGLANESTMNRPVGEMRESLLSTVVDVVVHGREQNDKKATKLRVASISLAVGVSGIACQAATLPFA